MGKYLEVEGEGGAILLGEHEDLSLIYTTKLDINIKVLLIQGLEDGVDETTQSGIFNLFDDFGTSLSSVVGGDEGGQSVDIEGVLLGELEIGTHNKLEFIERDTNGAEHGLRR